MQLNTSRTINELVTAIGYVLDVMNETTNLYHSWRVSIFASEFAKEILPQDRKELFYAAILHDIGYLALPDHISHYLSTKEDPTLNAVVLPHPIIGAEIISWIPNFDNIAKLILNHHEWYNGKGYPLGRQRNEIPLGSQIILLADHIDLLLRQEQIKNAKEMANILSSWKNERASSELIDSVISILKDKSYLFEATEKESITDLFNRVRQETGLIEMPTNADAIGITCEVFSQLIDTKHPPMIGHSKRVSVYSLLIALSMNLSHDDITKIKWAALLHDVGKLGISRRLINKPGSLTTQEFEIMQQHAKFTREILETINDFKDIALIASSDHERYGGRGYPNGLKGDQIPLSARIISVADAFDAMTSNRPYRKAVSSEEACKELEKNAGTQFDPEVVKQAVPVLRNLSLTFT